MPKSSIVKAVPRRIRYSEKDGYLLVVKITEGPQHLIDRIIQVQITADQLNAIADWDANEVSVCELESHPPQKE